MKYDQTIGTPARSGHGSHAVQVRRRVAASSGATQPEASGQTIEVGPPPCAASNVAGECSPVIVSVNSG